jgi:hypothetical protein
MLINAMEVSIDFKGNWTIRNKMWHCEFEANVQR